MFTRVLLVLAAGVGLSACQPAIPESGIPNPGRGVGFDNSVEAQVRAQRDAALTTSTVPAAPPVASQPLGTPSDGSAAATAAETTRVLAATSGAQTGARAAGQGPIVASPSNPPPPVLDGGGISRENNFDAVASQRGIESDAARIAANRAQYQVVQPEALPDRGNAGPNIVAYALANKHPVGTRVYNRVGFNKQSKFERACAKYARPTDAQIAFLEAGGPRRDRAGLDPDGDGYACSWDPTPFRVAASG